MACFPGNPFTEQAASQSTQWVSVILKGVLTGLGRAFSTTSLHLQVYNCTWCTGIYYMYSVKELLVNCRPAGKILCNHNSLFTGTCTHDPADWVLYRPSSGRKPVQKVMTVSWDNFDLSKNNIKSSQSHWSQTFWNMIILPVS